MITIKKYSNRRLYDTSESRYITLEDLAAIIRSGVDVKVIDAKTDEDLTRAILSQIVMESRGGARLLPEQTSMQLIRMEDDELGAFLGQYMSSALEFYQRMRIGARNMGAPTQNPGMYGAPSPFAQWMGQMYGGGWPGAFGGQMNPMNQGGFPGQAQGFGPPPEPTPTAPAPAPTPAPTPPPAPPEPVAAPEPTPSASGEVAQMREELAELKELIKMAALGNMSGD